LGKNPASLPITQKGTREFAGSSLATLASPRSPVVAGVLQSNKGEDTELKNFGGSNLNIMQLKLSKKTRLQKFGGLTLNYIKLKLK
jgi:hypothetical protein